MALYLGVDMGGTASRWVSVDGAGTVIARGKARGGTALLHDASSMAAFTEALEGISRALDAPPTSAHLGLTGASFSKDLQLESLITSALGLPPERFTYCNDVVLAWHAAFKGGRGHLVSTGTGSIGVSMDEAGKPVITGGRGLLLGDGGSGTWIALNALEQVFRKIDRHGKPLGAELLAEYLFAEIGGEDQEAMINYVYGSHRGRIGMLAMAVAKAAKEGDPSAQNIMLATGYELVRLASALMERNGKARIAFIGRVLTLHPVIRQTIEQELAGEEIDFPVLDEPLHAAQTARSQSTKTN